MIARSSGDPSLDSRELPMDLDDTKNPVRGVANNHYTMGRNEFPTAKRSNSIEEFPFIHAQ